jgi:hypothetical protein
MKESYYYFDNVCHYYRQFASGMCLTVYFGSVNTEIDYSQFNCSSFSDFDSFSRIDKDTFNAIFLLASLKLCKLILL